MNVEFPQFSGHLGSHLKLRLWPISTASSNLIAYTLVQIFWYIETGDYNVVPMVFNVIGLADPGEKGENVFLLATNLDAILIFSEISDHYWREIHHSLFVIHFIQMWLDWYQNVFNIVQHWFPHFWRPSWTPSWIATLAHKYQKCIRQVS